MKAEARTPIFRSQHALQIYCTILIKPLSYVPYFLNLQNKDNTFILGL